jgi:hypothetical protein
MSEYLLFQFEVDNAATLERSVFLLLSALPTHPDWVRTYLVMTTHPNLRAAFFDTYIPRCEEPDVLRDFLPATQYSPSLWNLAEATSEIQEVLLEVLEFRNRPFGSIRKV